MGVREAVEPDAGAIAGLTDRPPAVVRNLIHDRTVRVVDDGDDIRGFVSFDASEGTVHVTQLAGDEDCYEQLLDEPIRFARREGMVVEILVPADEEHIGDAAAAAGFDRVGRGPRFDGDPTTRYRLVDP